MRKLQDIKLTQKIKCHDFNIHSILQKNTICMVQIGRLELPRSNFHYPLKVARLPIPPPLQVFCYISSSAQNRTRTCTYKHTHLKRARLPIPPPGHFENRSLSTYTNISKKSGKRDSNSRPQPWQGCALPTELFPQNKHFTKCFK